MQEARLVVVVEKRYEPHLGIGVVIRGNVREMRVNLAGRVGGETKDAVDQKIKRISHKAVRWRHTLRQT